MQIFNFLMQYWEIVETILFVLLSVVLFFRTNDKKYLKEVREMLYRTENSVTRDNKLSQTFSSFKPTFKVNDATKELEISGKVDVQELVNSCKEMCLQSVLDRFMPTAQTLNSSLQNEVSVLNDDLDYFMKVTSLANDYKEKLNLEPSLSVNDVFAKVKELSDKLKTNMEVKANAQKKNANVEESK